MRSSFFLEKHSLCGYNNIVCVIVSTRRGMRKQTKPSVRVRLRGRVKKTAALRTGGENVRETSPIR